MIHEEVSSSGRKNLRTTSDSGMTQQMALHTRSSELTRLCSARDSRFTSTFASALHSAVAVRGEPPSSVSASASTHLCGSASCVSRLQRQRNGGMS